VGPLGSGRGSLRVEGLRVERSGVPVLAVERLDLEAGAQACVTGPSGCGKTTLLSVLGGLLPATSGRVRLGGIDLTDPAWCHASGRDRLRAREVGLVPQQPLLIGALDLLDNVLAARHFAGLPPDRPATRHLLEQLGLGGLEHRRPGTLSRGQQQRVAIARALSVEPQLILADEPTANLDDEQAGIVLTLLSQRAARIGATLLIATHDARVRERLATALVLPRRAAAGKAAP
jgi:putative ABC transport system ATP-binding protein